MSQDSVSDEGGAVVQLHRSSPERGATAPAPPSSLSHPPAPVSLALIERAADRLGEVRVSDTDRLRLVALEVSGALDRIVAYERTRAVLLADYATTVRGVRKSFDRDMRRLDRKTALVAVRAIDLENILMLAEFALGARVPASEDGDGGSAA